MGIQSQGLLNQAPTSSEKQPAALAGEDVMPPLSSWEQLQIAFPAVRKRLIPLADAGT